MIIHDLKILKEQRLIQAILEKLKMNKKYIILLLNEVNKAYLLRLKKQIYKTV